MQLPDNISMIAVQDPGLTTGFVTLSAHGEFNSRQMKFKETCFDLLSLGSTYGERLIIVSESFRITMQTAKNTQAPWSLELIGVARMVSELYCKKELVIQDPSAAKRFSSDNRLKTMGWFTKNMGHANDAARHLLLFMATRGWLGNDTLKQLVEV